MYRLRSRLGMQGNVDTAIGWTRELWMFVRSESFTGEIIKAAGASMAAASRRPEQSGAERVEHDGKSPRDRRGLGIW